MVSSSNGISNKVGATIAGVTNTLTITNPSNTGSSAARTSITVGGGSAADPTLNFNVSGVTDWEMGIDNNDSDKWKLSQGTALGTNDTIVAYTTGNVVQPLQSSFRAYISADRTNVTGDGTEYPVIFDSTDFNIGTNYDTSTGLYTAPVDGIYVFRFRFRLTGLSASNVDGIIKIGNDPVTRLNWANIRNSGNACALEASTVYQLTASDTVGCTVQINSGTKTVSLSNIDNITTVFIGYLIH